MSNFVINTERERERKKRERGERREKRGKEGERKLFFENFLSLIGN